MRKIVLLTVAMFSFVAVHAQDSIPDGARFKKNHVFRNLDVSLSAGTTGIGIDVASKIGDYVQLRVGYDYMPRFKKSVYFPVEVGGQAARLYDKNGNRIESRFDRLSKVLTSLTGFSVDDEIEMVCKPTVNNFKFLVDVFPFKNNKHWHFTAGFYWGPSKFAYAENSTEAMTTLLAVSMYNQMYEKCVADLPLIDIDNMSPVYLDYSIQEKIADYGRMGFSVGQYKNDVYDPASTGANGEYGLLHKAGDSYMMEPGTDGMVKVTAKSNSFKPYLGFGYGGRLVRNRDDWHVSFDAGAMFWGGTPDLYTHEGVNLTKDITGATGKVGDWIDFIGGIKVYPVLSVRFTKTIF